MFTNALAFLCGVAFAVPTLPAIETVQVLPDGDDATGALVAREWGNGTVVVVEDHRVPLVSVTLSLRTGERDRWWHANDLDYLWRTLITPEIRDGRDPRFSAWVAGYSCGLSFTARPADLGELMGLVHARLVTEYDEYQRTIRRPRARRAWRMQLASPEFVISQAIARAYFRLTDPRRLDYELPEFLPTKDIDLVELRDALVASDGWIWSFAGDIDVDTAITQVARTMPANSVLGQAREIETFPLPQRLGAAGQTTTLGLPGIEEVVTALARPGLGLADPDADAALLADAVVVRRLERVVRQGRGDSYAFTTDGLLAITPDVYVMTSMTSPPRVDAHRHAVMAELARIAAGGLDFEEIERARRVLRMSELRKSQAPDERAQVWIRDLHRSELAPGSQDLGERGLSVSAERVSAFAREFYSPEMFSEFALGPTPWAQAEQRAQAAAKKALEQAASAAPPPPTEAPTQ